MDNRNNPVARSIEEIQRRWSRAAQSCPSYKLLRFVIHPEDAPLINGFYKLESSRFGALPEFFVVLTTPFQSLISYSKQLISDWIFMWENDPVVKEMNATWDTTAFKDQAKNELSWDRSDKLFKEVAFDFAAKFCQPDQDLVLGIIPKSVADFSAFNDWVKSVGDYLPANIKLSFIDHDGKDYLKSSLWHFKDKALSLVCTDISTHQIARQMATVGDPNDPEIAFRKCLFEMADGVNSRNKAHIREWGNKAVGIALNTGKKDFIATAYLIYAGFLLQLKEEESDRLLDQGIKIADSAYYNGKEKECAPVLLQLYGFKAAFCRIQNQKKETCRWLQKQARLAVELLLFSYAVNQFRTLAQIAHQAWESEIYSDSLKEGYQAGDTLSEEELRTSEIGTLAWYYAKELREDRQTARAAEIIERMNRILGPGWEEKVPSFSDKYVQSTPDIKEALNISSY